MAKGLEEIAALPDPVGAVRSPPGTRPNGLDIERVRTPLGVIGVIYESRPNVTADAGALCLKAATPLILRGGSDALPFLPRHPRLPGRRARAAGLPAEAIQLVPTRDRAAVGHHAHRPRRQRSTSSCRAAARASSPACRRRRGCRSSRISKASATSTSTRGRPRDGAAIVVNAKMRRTGVCGAAETLLVDRACAPTHLDRWSRTCRRPAARCAATPHALRAALSGVKPAGEADWTTEYLDAIIAVKVVDGLDAAIAHIETHGSHHTDAIVTDDAAAAERFMAEVDSRDRAAQRLDPVRRRRRVRHGGRDRHRHRPHARPRAGRRRAADELQVSRARTRPDTSVNDPAGAGEGRQTPGADWLRVPPVGARHAHRALSAARSTRRTDAHLAVSRDGADASRCRPRLVDGHAPATRSRRTTA
jgi:glutamate-5-semialdehyde dehydrogenase